MHLIFTKDDHRYEYPGDTQQAMDWYAEQFAQGKVWTYVGDDEEFWDFLDAFSTSLDEIDASIPIRSIYVCSECLEEFYIDTEFDKHGCSGESSQT